MGDETPKRHWIGWGPALLLLVGVGAWIGLSTSSEDAGRETESFEETWDDEWAEAEAPERETEPEETAEESENSPDESRDDSSETAHVEEDEATITFEEREASDRRFPGQRSGEREEYKPAVLEVVTNFDKADVTVNGLPYPEYKNEDEDEQGMVLPAGGPYTVKVSYDGKTKTYTLSLRPYEVRLLMVELSGFKGGPVAPAATTARATNKPKKKKKKKKKKNGKGRVTVYSKPKGTVHVDGEPKNQQTPGTVQVAAGQHDIQVKFNSGQMSESKTVRVREGSRIKLFFRKRGD